MIRTNWLLCSRCRLCFNNVSGFKHISQRTLLSSQVQVQLSNKYCNNVGDTVKAPAPVDHATITFNEIYRFPSIRFGFFLHKLKWQQTVVAAVAIPSSVVFYFCGLIDSTWTINVILSGIMLTLNLYGMSALFKNAVGFLYLSEDETTLKISFLDFWGKRIDKEFPVEDVVPFLDAPRPPTDYMYKQLVFYSTDSTKLKLFMTRGKITDKDKFDKVFGPLE